MDTKLTLGNVNCRSLLQHFNNLEEHVLDKKYSLVAVSETWLNADINNDAVKVNGYRIVGKDRQGRGGKTLTFEILALSFKLSGLKFTAAVIYRPPGCGNMDSFFSEFDETVAMLHLKCDRLILTGDFKINMLKIDNSHDKSF
nr:unnamed protein product [Callosobruchus chinensis]